MEEQNWKHEVSAVRTKTEKATTAEDHRCPCCEHWRRRAISTEKLSPLTRSIPI